MKASSIRPPVRNIPNQHRVRARWPVLGVALIGIWSAGLTEVRRGTPRLEREAPQVASPARSVGQARDAPFVPDRARAHAEAQPPPQVQSQRSEFETRFREESADPEWAAQFSQHLRNLLAAVGISEGAIRALQCKSTLCRVELAGADVSALTAIAGQLATPYSVQPTTAGTLDILIVRPSDRSQGI